VAEEWIASGDGDPSGRSEFRPRVGRDPDVQAGAGGGARNWRWRRCWTTRRTITPRRCCCTRSAATPPSSTT
jgi:hypothetical protein